ncbi:MAG: NAD(P)-binding domain-containing protein [Cumulibacter sp.]
MGQANDAGERVYDVIVVGAGQAGLSAAGHLVRKGVQPWSDFVILDANDGPGGAWRHRWDSLTFDRAHGIHDLPGMSLGAADPEEPASRVVARYYGQYEAELALPVVRPVAVSCVRREGDVFGIKSEDGRQWRARTVISAAGTWDSPYVPYYPGIADFRGRYLHTRGFTAPEDFVDQDVLVVGGGASALQFLLQLDAAGARTVWSTRRTPGWTTPISGPDWGIDVEAMVAERTRSGLPPTSVASVTGVPLTEQYRDGLDAGVLISRGGLSRILGDAVILDGPGPDGRGAPSQGLIADRILAEGGMSRIRQLPGSPLDASMSNGEHPWRTPIDTILWATGFRASLNHLAPLRIREPGGGVRMAPDGVSVPRAPGLFLVGYGASASTIGATRAGRKAAIAALRAVSDPVSA